MSSLSQSIPASHGLPVPVSSAIMVASVVILFCLFIFFLVLYLRSNIYMSSRAAVESSPGYMDGGGTSVVHRRALDPVVLKSLPVSVFRTVQFKDGMECAVCLSELTDGEHFRLLPACNHRFHIECIDMWFSSNSTCPICRSSLEPPPPQAEASNNVEATPSVNNRAWPQWIGMGRMAMQGNDSEAGSSNSRRPGRIVAVIDTSRQAIESSTLSSQPSQISLSEEMKLPASESGVNSGCFCARGWDIEHGLPGAAGVREEGEGSSSSSIFFEKSIR